VEELTAFPYPLSGFQGATSDRRGGKGEELGMEGLEPCIVWHDVNEY